MIFTLQIFMRGEFLMKNKIKQGLKLLLVLSILVVGSVFVGGETAHAAKTLPWSQDYTQNRITGNQSARFNFVSRRVADNVYISHTENVRIDRTLFTDTYRTFFIHYTLR